ncbi:MAG: hypothetical protein KatS3mg034_0598 [Vicingaceae bacterium]|nr:MAG: hypothetical protein KatS3mg034_0598 [Vicingaceae bacterium]
MKRVSYFHIFLCLCNVLFASEKFYLVDIDKSVLVNTELKLLDSCLNKFHSEKTDSSKIYWIEQIIENSNNEKIWYKYNLWLYNYIKPKLKDISRLNSDERRLYLGTLGNILNNTGFYYRTHDQNDKAEFYYLAALKIQQLLEDNKKLAITYNNLGTLYNSRGDYGKAAEYLFQAAKLNETIGDSLMQGYCLLNLAMVYENLHDYELAFDNCLKAINIFESLDKLSLLAIAYNNLGNLYFSKELYEQAKKYFIKSYELRKKYQLPDIEKTLINLALIYLHQNDAIKAKYFLKQVFQDKKNFEHLNAETQTNAWLTSARIELKMGNYQNALEQAQKAMNIAREIKSKYLVSESALLLSQLYSQMGEYKEMEKYLNLYVDLIKEIFSEDTRKKMIQQQVSFQMEKLQALREEQLKNNLILEKEKQKRQNILLIAFSILGILLVIYLRQLSKTLQIVKNQKLEIEKSHQLLSIKNKDITDSIKYAKRIQEALIKQASVDLQAIGDYFLMFMPKDIVSGDFYWSKKIETKEHSVTFFCLADCTGHGVPGAFMTLLGISFLNELIELNPHISSAELLSCLKKKIIEALNQNENDNKDGMDVSLIRFDHRDGKMQWSGAFLSLYIVTKNKNHYLQYFSTDRIRIFEKNNNYIIEIIGDKMPVGKYRDTDKKFSQVEFKPLSGDLMYMTTDGYCDQFGGPQSKKFKYNQFRDLLFSMADYNVSHQLNILQDTFYRWKGENEQTDDITVFGIRIH